MVFHDPQKAIDLTGQNNSRSRSDCTSTMSPKTCDVRVWWMVLLNKPSYVASVNLLNIADYRYAS